MPAALILSLTLAAAPAPIQGAGSDAPSQAQPFNLYDIDRALVRGGRWLRAWRNDDGTFAPAGEGEVCVAALSAVALWALHEGPFRLIETHDGECVARYLMSNRRADGGIYDPVWGAEIPTTGLAAKALRTFGARENWPSLGSALAGAELFLDRSARTEARIGLGEGSETFPSASAEAARRLLRDSRPASRGIRRALEFLGHRNAETVGAPPRPGSPSSDSGSFPYPELAPLMYFELPPEHRTFSRADAALRLHFAVDRQPPVSQQTVGPAVPGSDHGLFFYYYVVAETLSTRSLPTLVTSDGVAHDWPEEIAQRLIAIQHPRGYWAGAEGSAWEVEANVATAYAILALKRCREGMAQRLAANR